MKCRRKIGKNKGAFLEKKKARKSQKAALPWNKTCNSSDITLPSWKFMIKRRNFDTFLIFWKFLFNFLSLMYQEKVFLYFCKQICKTNEYEKYKKILKFRLRIIFKSYFNSYRKGRKRQKVQCWR